MNVAYNESERAKAIELVKLVENWRSYKPMFSNPISETLHRCADELEAALAQPARSAAPDDSGKTTDSKAQWAANPLGVSKKGGSAK